MPLQHWGEFGRLAYSACFMKVAESWAFGLLVLFAGALQRPAPPINPPHGPRTAGLHSTILWAENP